MEDKYLVRFRNSFFILLPPLKFHKRAMRAINARNTLLILSNRKTPPNQPSSLYLKYCTRHSRATEEHKNITPANQLKEIFLP
jgi:hypothetical protein